MPALRDRRRSQSGTTLVEMLVSLVIISTALALVVGTLSTGALNAVLTKRNTAAEAVVQYEMDTIGAGTYSQSPSPYSDCFAVDNSNRPAPAAGYQGSCPSGYSLRADVKVQWVPSQVTVQSWTITVVDLNRGVTVGTPISLYKAPRQ